MSKSLQERDGCGMAMTLSEADTLRRHGLRVTGQRIGVLDYLLEHRDHPDARAIYERLKSDNPSLSMTTVYATLQAFVDAGLVDELTISGTERRYEVHRGMHHHLLCGGCGRILNIDVECPYLNGMLGSGHKIDSVHGYFKGICKDCLGKKGMKGKRKSGNKARREG